jgi:type I restriction enzyme M protein
MAAAAPLPQPLTAPESFLARAIANDHARIATVGNKRRITYMAAQRTEAYDDPEELVRAEYWAELIYRYGYDADCIGVEVIVPDRTPHDAADIVVFTDKERKTPFAVIECKRDGISDPEFEQAVEQVVGNGTWGKLRASYVGVVAGMTRRFLDVTGTWGILEREKNIIADLPAQYGKPQEWKYRKDGTLDIKPVSREALIQAIRKSHQTLWAGGKLAPPTAFGELCKLIFVKISDEQRPRKTGEPYDFQIKTHEPAQKLSERVRLLYKKEQERDPEVFTDTIKIGDSEIRQIVSHLEGINLTATDLDVKGVAFEQFMDGFFKGDFGQYFTPRPLIEFAVKMIEPKNDDLVLDPACGSGGFLLYAMNAIRQEATEYYKPSTPEHFKHWHDFAQRRIFGIEINDEICRVAKMNMIIHDDGHSNVVGADALRHITDLTRLNPQLKKGAFHLVLTNPPFGATVDSASHRYVGTYELGQTKPTRAGKRGVRKTQKSEVLFIERVWDFLAENGRAAIILPDGILANDQTAYIREFILERFEVLAVVSLPALAFSHYGAGVKASLVFLRKRAAEEHPDDDEVTFMAAPDKIGYDATGRETVSELDDIVAEYRAFRKQPSAYL